MPAGSGRVATYIEQLFYVHFLIDLFSKNVLILPNKHNIGICQIHSWFLLWGKSTGNRTILVLIVKIYLITTLEKHSLYFKSYTRKICLRSTIVVVPLPSRVRLFVTLWTAALQASLSLTVSWSLPKFMPIASVIKEKRSTMDTFKLHNWSK